MDRRTFLRGFGFVSVLGLAGCLDVDDADDEELVGEGRLRMENQSGGSITPAYGLLDAETAIEDADLRTQRLTLNGDAVEIVYPDVTGGPYRFVVAAPDRDWQPVESRWALTDCVNLTVGVTARPDALNVSSTSCVVGPERSTTRD
jgi:hypothetical protein